jgi:hypothetical protein
MVCVQGRQEKSEKPEKVKTDESLLVVTGVKHETHASLEQQRTQHASGFNEAQTKTLMEAGFSVRTLTHT